MRKRGGRIQHDTKDVERSHPGAKGKIEAHGKLEDAATTDKLLGPSADKKGTLAGANSDIHRERGKTDRKRGGKVGHASENGGMNGADKIGRTGIGFRQPVQHSGNKDDTQNIGRKKPITFAKGGKVKDANEIGGEKQYARAAKFDGDGDKPAGGRDQYKKGWNVHTGGTLDRVRAKGGRVKNDGGEKQYEDGLNYDRRHEGKRQRGEYATGGAIYSDGRENVGMGPDTHAGSRGGLGRLYKAHHMGGK